MASGEGFRFVGFIWPQLQSTSWRPPPLCQTARDFVLVGELQERQQDFEAALASYTLALEREKPPVEARASLEPEVGGQRKVRPAGASSCWTPSSPSKNFSSHPPPVPRLELCPSWGRARGKKGILLKKARSNENRSFWPDV